MRDKSKFVNDKRVGLGSFFLCQEFDYSNQEFYQSQGHKDRIRTADCNEVDRKTRRDNDDDSHRPSDWKERTGTHRAWSFKNHSTYAKAAICMAVK